MSTFPSREELPPFGPTPKGPARAEGVPRAGGAPGDARRASGPGATRGPALLAAAPLFALLDDLRRGAAELTELAPGSDVCRTSTRFAERLAGAIAEAGDIRLWITVAEAALILGRTTSAVTHLCRTRALRARHDGGTWSIDRRSLELLRAARAGDGPAGPDDAAGGATAPRPSGRPRPGGGRATTGGRPVSRAAAGGADGRPDGREGAP